MKFNLLRCCALFISLSLLSCGGGSSPTASPAPLTVSASASLPFLKKGESLAFTASESGITWSVEGGDSNGTITADGVYSPPAVLPLNPRVIIKATSSSESASSSINLYVGDTLVFATPPTVLNASPMAGVFALSDLRYTGSDDQLALFGNDLNVFAHWLQGTSAPTTVDVHYTQATALGSFSTAENLTASIANFQMASAVEVDSSGNPHVLILDDRITAAQPRISFLHSNDGGTSFSYSETFPDPAPAPYQMAGAFHIDDADKFHVTYIETTSIAGSIMLGALKYVRSEDKGATWGTPLELGDVTRPRGSTHVVARASKVYVCYAQIDAGPPVTANTYLVVSNDGGSSFAAPVKVSSLGDSAFCKMALGNSGNLFVAYYEQNNVHVAKSIDGGATIASRTQVNATSIFNEEAALFLDVDALGRLSVAFNADSDNDGFFQELLFSRSLDEGSSFSTPVELHPSARQYMFPMGMTHDNAGRIHLMYQDDTNSVGTAVDVFYTRGE